MKKLLILLAALSLVACGSNEPKKDTVETTPVVVEEVMVEENVVEEALMRDVVETAAVEEEVMVEENVVEEALMRDVAPTTYTVMEGDNLFKIGLKYNMSWEKLAEENNISNPDVLVPGQVLTIPAE